MSRDSDQKRGVNKQKTTAFKKFPDFHPQKRTLLSANSAPSQSPMAYNNTASMDQLYRLWKLSGQILTLLMVQSIKWM